MASTTWNVLVTALRKIWAACNGILFRSIDQRSVITLRLIISDLDMWSHSLMKLGDKEDVFSWRSYLSTPSVPKYMSTEGVL